MILALLLAIGWANVSPPQFLSPINMETQGVVVDPTNGYVYSSAGNITNSCGGANPPCQATGIYRSIDCGTSWTQVSTGTNSAALLTGLAWSMRIDPVTPTTFYTANGYGSPPAMFKTTDGGVNFTQLSPDSAATLLGGQNFVQAIALDPANHLHLAVTFHDTCHTPYNPLCLSYSNDGGSTWTVFSGPSAATAWEEAASLTIFGANSYFLTDTDGAYYTTNANLGASATWTSVYTGSIFGSYGAGVWTTGAGNHYFGITNLGIYSSSSWTGPFTALSGTPNATTIFDDGTTMFASNSPDTSGQPMHQAALSSLTTWTTTSTPTIARGAYAYGYDPIHKILYGACLGAGLWQYTSALTSACGLAAPRGFQAGKRLRGHR